MHILSEEVANGTDIAFDNRSQFSHFRERFNSPQTILVQRGAA
jgi:hypothetical protein